ncbi:MAG: four helix bundle protein [Anaerolineales bacterium]|nr:MAG: four helix bundle protein [Anaerolineales bacterium]
MTYEEWLAQVPDSLKNDPIWKFEAYPKSLLLYDLAWEDTDKLLKDVRGRKLAGQVIDSAGSVSANIDEGFGRGIESGEYIQFLRYALGSARETRSWYYKARRLLTAEAVRHRIALCDEIIALLVVTIKQRLARRRQ